MQGPPDRPFKIGCRGPFQWLATQETGCFFIGGRADRSIGVRFFGPCLCVGTLGCCSAKLAYPLVVRRGPSRDGDAADSVLERGVGNRRPAVEMFSLFCGFQLVIIFAVARGLSLSWWLQPWQNEEVRGPRQRTLERAMLVVAIEMLRPVLVKKAMCPTCRSDPAIA